jgi:hypothetical protein
MASAVSTVLLVYLDAQLQVWHMIMPAALELGPCLLMLQLQNPIAYCTVCDPVGVALPTLINLQPT